MKTKTCIRCKGTGFVNSPVEHLGVAGLCMKCDGMKTLRWMSAEEVRCNQEKLAVEHRRELQERAAWLKGRIAKTRSQVLTTRYEAELDQLRDAWRAAATPQQPQGCWVPNARKN